MVRRRFPLAQAAVVGGEHDLEPGYRAALEAQIRRLEMGESMLLAGYQDNVPDWMQAMDVIVHASDREPFGITVLEAMALGKPVIASIPGGPSEIITDGLDGLLVESGDPALLARSIFRFLDDPEFSRRCGEHARTRACEFDIERYARSLHSAVDQLINGGSQ